ncbi:hypothetical protein [Kitasatospora sp. DSM 101779]|uniref:hypothetical protein n=1 Tax=Kitasatospora sp. DSM 101779 TaxID=2853165 RepID=UPI0021D87A6B|nr:hypothetical protein [Kitasatospora sp. DSM 101779]MCU7821350.1 hypothetical protein [Kitasatospora sp. DSM 101779]
MTKSRATRVLRAAVFTALAVPLAALGQVVLTGRPLPMTLVLACTAAVFLVAVALDGARHSLWRLTAVMVPVELLLNTAFNLGQDGCTTVAARSHGVDLLVCGGGSVDGSPMLSGLAGQSAGSLRLVVLLAHLALALAAALWLRLGAAALGGAAQVLRALRAVAGAVAWRLLSVLAPLPACPAELAPSPDTRESLPRPESVVPSPAPRRGPPVFALAC